MGDFLIEMVFGGLLLCLRDRHPVLYAAVMGCILVLFGAIAVFFYAVGSPVKGTFMVVFTLLMLVLLLYSFRKTPGPDRPSWNSWFAKRR